MKKAIIIILSLMFVATFAFAGGSGETQTAAAPSGPVYKESIVLGDGSQITTGDPQSINNMQHNRIFKCSHNTLVSYNSATSSYEPELATSWEWSSDLLTLTLKLRNDVTFQNGEKFTANDVKYSYERIMGMNSTASSKFVGVLDHVEVVDDYTVKLVLVSPNVDWLDTLALPLASIVNQKAIEADELKGPWVGTGMWIITDLEEGDFVHMVKNDNYWGGTTPTRELTFRYIPEESARLIALQNGEIDVCIGPADTELDYIRSDKNLVLIEIPSATCCYFSFNTSKGPGSDENLRLALAYSINYEDVIFGASSGTGTRAISNWGPVTFGYYDGFGDYERNLDLAKEYLAKSAYKEILISVRDDERMRAAQIIQSNAREIGLTVNIEKIEAAALTAKSAFKTAEHESMIYTLGWNSYGDDASRAYGVGSNTNKATLTNDRVMELLEIGRSTTDAEARKAAYAEIQTLNHEHAWYLPLYYTGLAVATRTGVSGVIWEGHQSHDYQNIVATK
ncbi:MAG: ABC transporter substrate-binding protein [Spirochaetales bacterium]|nr:ABC transporter substrate-binding protein [Spirochaetales bacterium]